MEIFWVTLIVFGGFEIALLLNYVLLKFLLRTMQASLKVEVNPQSEIRNPKW